MWALTDSNCRPLPCKSQLETSHTSDHAVKIAGQKRFLANADYRNWSLLRAFFWALDDFLMTACRRGGFSKRDTTDVDKRSHKPAMGGPGQGSNEFVAVDG